jgi:pimeloyl-ACP methyl ester carboxylesterase
MKRSRVWSSLWRLLLTGLMAYLSLTLLVGCVQRRLIYHPPRLSAAELQPYADAQQLQPWTNASGLRIGWWKPPPGVKPVVRVMLMHGNAGSAAGRDYLLVPLQAGVPAEVRLLEYPGFADRPGSPSQTTLLAAADEALDTLPRDLPLVLVAESLGTGVACYLAGTHPDRIAGVILLTPFNNLGATAGYHYPWLPVKTILLDRFPSDEWLPRYGGPVGVVLGLEDRVVPAELGRRLYAGYGGPKRLWEIPGAGHWEASQRPAEWWAEAFQFLRDPARPAGR